MYGVYIPFMKIDYCLMGSTQNPYYLDFWPIVSEVWKKIFNVTPVLGLISDKDTDFYESEYGLIKEFKFIGVSNDALQSQIVRMYLSKYLEGNCIISDLDIIPISKKYFIDDIKQFHDDELIVLSSHHPQTHGSNQYPMCYVAGHSSTFNKIFQTNLEWENFIKVVNKEDWFSDQLFLYESVQKYDKNKVKFPYRSFSNDRIDRSNWVYDETKVNQDFYVDSHLLRPYLPYKLEIDKLVSLLS